tara:strand:- start:396 stop:1505 length:1110 start_codon:yes stop_codon:yes gene_type:complete
VNNDVKVLHIIASLGQGGAERQLLELLDNNITHEVCQLVPKGYYESYLRNKGTKIYNLNMKRGLPDIRVFYELNKVINTSKPKIIHCWMYHSCLIEAILRKFGFNKKIPIIWGIRCSNMDTKFYSFQLNMVIKACKIFSSNTNLIINNSHIGKITHDELGFNKKSIVVANGIDIDKFFQNINARVDFRKRYNISNDIKILLCVSRVDPMKDHQTLLEAFKKIKLFFPNVILILAGIGTEKYINEEKVIALGAYKNIHEVYSASDIIISSSAFGEGFSNAIGEGMASGLIPISTDVGDAKEIIGDKGIVVPVRDKNKMHDAIKEVLNFDKYEFNIRKNEVRERIVNKYTKEKMVLNYKNIYNSIINGVEN